MESLLVAETDTGEIVGFALGNAGETSKFLGLWLAGLAGGSRSLAGQGRWQAFVGQVN